MEWNVQKFYLILILLFNEKIEYSIINSVNNLYSSNNKLYNSPLLLNPLL